MKIDIAHIAKLARLKIESERFAKFEKEMELKWEIRKDLSLQD